MATETVDALAELTSPAANDEIGIWDVSAAQYMRITRANLVGGTITGGGTVATGGYTLTVPATGTAALLATANVFTAAQEVIGAAVGGRQAASGNGAALCYVGPAMNRSISLANGGVATVTFAGDGVLLMLDIGYMALLFVTYVSTMIVELADPNSIVPDFISVTKSANSGAVAFTNVSGSSRYFQVMALGVLTGITVA